MKRETMILTIVLVVLAAGLALRLVQTGGAVGTQYVEHVRTIHVYEQPGIEWSTERSAWVDEATNEAVDPATFPPDREWIAQRTVPKTRAGDPDVRFSVSRTIGLWLAALLSLFVFSFLYRDNALYKFAESLVVGVSAGYAAVVAFWTDLIPRLIGNLFPEVVRSHFSPELDAARNWAYVIPLILGIMLLWRLAPKGAWIARWPLAFIIGLTAGMRLIGYLHADGIAQVEASIVPFVVFAHDGQFLFWASMRNAVTVLSLLACLTYFFFSIEHKGVVGRTARIGIWVLMITFGAGFAYTVMGRITLLTQRVEFLFNDWLWIIQ